jgi:FkbM family methyltransferase
MSLGSGIAYRMKATRWRMLRATRRTVTVQTRQGRLTVYTRDDVIARLLFMERQFQQDTADHALAFLRGQGLMPPRGRGTVLDVGANLGVISIGMLVNGDIDAAIGVEPDPDNYALLERNIAQNRCGDRYTPIRVAVSDRAGDLELALSRHNLGDHRIQRPGAAQAGEGEVIAVPACTIDEIVGRLPTAAADAISLVWIDVQGHEGHVFAGGAELFSRDIPVLSEVWPYGILRSGMELEHFCRLAQRYWSSYWVWRRSQRYVQYSIADLPKFCEELGSAGAHDDVIFTRA